MSKTDFEYAYLEHHGILGQKWGVRRYQNSDGSLTDAGKRRYAQSVVRTTKHSQVASKAKLSKEVDAELTDRLLKHKEEIKELQKKEHAPYDYENKKLWSKPDVLDKYCNKKADDDIKQGLYDESDRKHMIELMKYDDIGQDIFHTYYLPDNPKEQKEYNKIFDEATKAYKRQSEIENAIVDDIVGSYGKTKMTSIPTYRTFENGRWNTRQTASVGSVLVSQMRNKESYWRNEWRNN